MKLLVLGGTRFVGRTVVAEALDRGWEVTALHRGVTRGLPAGAKELLADRTDRAALREALGTGEWDVVVDTWAAAPQVATASAELLRGRAGCYGYVSTSGVYVWGEHVDEDSPLVEGDPHAGQVDYAADKRGAEIGVLASFPHALLARAGLVLGPYEDSARWHDGAEGPAAPPVLGRLPWWLRRIAEGGRVVAPGRRERPLQYVDARDLAGWLLDGLAAGLRGPVDVISRSGHATMEQLLAACAEVTGSGAELVWVSEPDLATAGAEPWTQLPCWVPESGEFTGFLESDTSRAAQTGLRCRPVGETVADTWAWLQQTGAPDRPLDRSVHGLPAELEQRLLAAAVDQGAVRRG